MLRKLCLILIADTAVFREFAMQKHPKLRGVAAFLVGSLLLTACAGAEAVAPMTSLQIQALQSREFETSKEIAFASVLSVFQDLGYIVEGADQQTGFITAKSATQNSTSLGQAMFGVVSNSQTSSTAFIEHLPSGMTRVRLNFMTSEFRSAQYGQSTTSGIPIYDAEIYANAFEKIGEGIFIRTASE
jgi:hypothetical protein